MKDDYKLYVTVQRWFYKIFGSSPSTRNTSGLGGNIFVYKNIYKCISFGFDFIDFLIFFLIFLISTFVRTVPSFYYYLQRKVLIWVERYYVQNSTRTTPRHLRFALHF